MSWSPKVILASNFYGSYLHAEDFDDTVIIADGNIEQLISAAQRRVEIYAKLTNREAELYVFCLLGLTDMVEKLTVGTQYVLKPIPDSVPFLERKMETAVTQMQRLGAKIIWSTTFPISLAKYHKSQGWNVDNMAQFGLSKGMVVEQSQLFDMTERFMDVCHMFNHRNGLQDLFFISKVYYSRGGQRELLTHNLLDDGINPSSSVTAEWNLELSKYLLQLRQKKSAIPSLLDPNLGPTNRGDSVKKFSSGKTLFNYGSGAGLLKRPTEPDYDAYHKKPKIDDSIVSKLETQPEDVQKKLAIGMLKFISDNLGEDALNTKSGQLGSALGNTTSSQYGREGEDRDYRENLNTGSGFNYANNSTFGFGAGSSSQYSGRSNEQFGHSASGYFENNSIRPLMGADVNYPGNFDLGPSGYGGSNSKNSAGFAGYDSTNGAKSTNSYKSQTFPPRKRSRPRRKTLAQLAREEPGKTKTPSDATAQSPKDSQGIESRFAEASKQLDQNSESSKSSSRPTVITIDDTIPENTSTEHLSVQKLPSKVDALSRDSAGVRKPRYATSRSDSKNQNEVAPLMKEPHFPIRNVPSLVTGSSSMRASDDFLLNAAGGAKKPALLVEPRSSNYQRNIELQYDQASGHVPLMSAPVSPHPDLNSSPAYCEVKAIAPGIPNLIKSLVTGDEPSFKTDKHGMRSDYILMAVKPSPHNAKIRRIIADYNDNENDKLHDAKIGSLRFAAFDRKQDLGDRDILPSVAFLKTNQWNPGYEKISAPMTSLQKKVAAFNTALYQLMKDRKMLLSKLGSNKDPTIRLSKNRYISAHEKLNSALRKSSALQKQDNVNNKQKSAPSGTGAANINVDKVLTESKQEVSDVVNDKIVHGDEKLAQANKKLACGENKIPDDDEKSDVKKVDADVETLDDDIQEVRGNIEKIDDIEGGDDDMEKEDDWTDLEEPDVIEFIDEGEDAEKARIEKCEKESRPEPMEFASDQADIIANSDECAKAVAQCFDIPEEGIKVEANPVELKNCKAAIEGSITESVVKKNKENVVEVIDLEPPVETINLETVEDADQAPQECEQSDDVEKTPVVKSGSVSNENAVDAKEEMSAIGNDDTSAEGAASAVESTTLKSNAVNDHPPSGNNQADQTHDSEMLVVQHEDGIAPNSSSNLNDKSSEKPGASTSSVEVVNLVSIDGKSVSADASEKLAVEPAFESVDNDAKNVKAPSETDKPDSKEIVSPELSDRKQSSPQTTRLTRSRTNVIAK